MVERYSYLKKAGFIKCGGGEYVLYSDYADLEAQLAERVRVKPLVWSDGWGVNKAQTDIGRYYIAVRSDGTYNWGLEDIWTAWASTPEKAKAAAQADYERRILSALEATPAPQTAERVRVKPLVWKELPGNQHCNIAFTADTIGGSFVIEERAGDTFDLWRMGQEIARRFGTLDEAKAAAQDWHNNAVAEVLEATPAPMVTEDRPTHCGGCGETDPAKRCFGCQADFGPAALTASEAKQ